MTDRITITMDELAERLGAKTTGCGDGYCDFAGRAKGMHTNAGCRCLSDVKPPELRALLRRKMIERLKALESRSHDR